jgi:DNA polymerase/3'-5' exonuclease PolX
MLVKQLIDALNKDIAELSKSPDNKNIVTVLENTIIKITTTKNLRDTINSADIDNLPSVADGLKTKLKDKIMTFNAGKNSASASNDIIAELISINGIGTQKALELHNAGVKTLKDLNEKKYFDMLSLESQLHLKFKPLNTIPRQYIQQIELFLNQLSNKVTLGGSYRRNNMTSGDIDVLIVDSSSANPSEENIWKVVREQLKKMNCLTNVYMQGPDKMSAIIKFPVADEETLKMLPRHVNQFVKVDFFRCVKEDYVFQLLYLTGSKTFNLAMRAQAKRNNMLLNQKGLFNVKTEGKKISYEQIPIKNEKEIFEKIGMTYRAPKERN